MGRKEERQDNTNQINKNRSCTDILCLLLFLVFIVGWVVVGVLGFMSGDPEQLVYPSNSRGDICGRGDFSDKPSLFFHDPVKCVSVTAVFGCSTPQVCVQECPQKTTSLYAYALWLQAQEGGDSYVGDFIDFDIDYQRQFCVPELTEEQWSAAKDDGKKLMELIDTRKCPPYTLESVDIVGRCLPDFGLVSGKNNDTEIKDEAGNNIDSPGGFLNVEKVLNAINKLIDILNARGFAERVWSDLVASKWMILAGEGIGVVVAFIWIFLMRFIASIMVWLSLFATIALLSLCAAYSWLKYDSFGQLETVNEETGITDINPFTQGFEMYLQIRDTWLAFFIISVVSLTIIVLITLFLRKRISLAVQLINESSRAVGSILSSLFYPIITFLLQLVVMVWFVIVCIFLASSSHQQFNVVNTGADEDCPQENDECDPGNYTAATDQCECVFTKYGPNELENYLQLYNLFGFFWGLCFVVALGEMVLAGTFSSWYWVLDKSDVPAFPVMNSFGRTLR